MLLSRTYKFVALRDFNAQFENYRKKPLNAQGVVPNDFLLITQLGQNFKDAFIRAGACASFEWKAVRHYFFDFDNVTHPDVFAQGFRTGRNEHTIFTLDPGDCAVFDGGPGPQIETKSEDQNGQGKPGNTFDARLHGLTAQFFVANETAIPVAKKKLVLRIEQQVTLSLRKNSKDRLKFDFVACISDYQSLI